MNFVILNGKKSTLIRGLLICELPHITKPAIRYQVDEVDGRDGDIITKLGYEAYSKELSIGLYDEFDINEVIKYFSGDGKVTFSNELDKYYNYQILEQIDYQRLIRFRTAKVKMHCQPFKYSAVEKPITQEGESEMYVVNNGNINSRPTLTLYGSGQVTVSLNDERIFSIVLQDEMTIDSERMEAFKGDTLLNRYILGDYDSLSLGVGKSKLSWTGNVTKAVIDKYSRWI